MAFLGAGTVLNTAAIVAGGLIGVGIGNRLPDRTRDIVTTGLGLTSLLMAGSAAVAVADHPRSPGRRHGARHRETRAEVVLDAFASMVFAASFGAVLDQAQISALTSVGGLMLAGIALRLLEIKPIPVGDLLPALLFAPVIVSLVRTF